MGVGAMGNAGEIDNQTPGNARRFAAFISYSHSDAIAAAKLQRRLERYRLPKRVAISRANMSSTLGSIFRDREDLAAAASLSVAIRDALGRTEALVVMCSPNAAASPWVAAEINLFRELHPEKPVLAVLLSGDPATAFPAALTAGGNEPLAADMRPDGDGEQLGFLKIVAGIAGVALDTLIQRDAQRRIRRVTAITAGALAAMLVMGIMTVYAISARNEAARQRASAEGLVEYMLTDLREKLRGVGRLDVMDAVNQRAIAHYDAQGDIANLPDESVERRARVLLAMGEDYDRRGEKEKAGRNFVDAHRMTATLLARDPFNADRVFAHAQSEYWVGYAAKLQNDTKGMFRHWQGYLSQARRLAELEPETVRSLMELGYAEGNLCEARLNEKTDLHAAETHCRRSVDFEEAALSKSKGDPKIRQDVANRYGWMAQTYYAREDYAKSAEARRRETAYMDELLVRDPKNVEYALRRSWAAIGMAAALLRLDQNRPAHDALMAAMNHDAVRSLEIDDDQRVAVTQVKLMGYLAKTELRRYGRISPTTQSRATQLLTQRNVPEKAKAVYTKILEEG